ncbi:hypothetical protein HY990_04805 [Candidatus Micrarchaeota archaeon]|nr:hypothetical protein [Candidatus Micrarchaeota archaeon]
MKSRDIIVDSGVLISLTAACLDPLFPFFSERFNVRFLIPPSVESETITYPLKTKIKKFLFSALKIKRLIKDGVIVRLDADVSSKARRLMSSANTAYFARAKPIQLIHLGEAEVLALSSELGIDHILVDERTTRLLIESPIKLKEHLESEFGINIMTHKTNLRDLSDSLSSLSLIRSSELVMLGFEKGYFDHFDDLRFDALEAALYATKYSGCSISFDEISQYLKSVR